VQLPVWRFYGAEGRKRGQSLTGTIIPAAKLAFRMLQRQLTFFYFLTGKQSLGVCPPA